MKEINSKYLRGCLLDVRVITKDEMGQEMLKRKEGSEKLCQILINLAKDLEEYMHIFEKEIKNSKREKEESENIKTFFEELIALFEETTFFHEKKAETWSTMTFLFFGIAVYHKASLRMANMPVLSNVVERLEKVIYDRMYWEITSFQY
jgi:hypothetical protein